MKTFNILQKAIFCFSLCIVFSSNSLTAQDMSLTTEGTDDFPTCNSDWKPIYPGSAHDIAVDGNNILWAIGSQAPHNLFKRDYNSIEKWEEIQAPAKRLAVDVNGNAYYIGPNNKTFKLKTDGTTVEFGGSGMDLAVNDNGTVYVIGTDNVVYQRSETAGWNGYIDSKKATYIAVNPIDGAPYIMGVDNIVYQGGGANWVAMGGVGEGHDITVDAFGTVWIVGPKKQIYFHDGIDWQLCDRAQGPYPTRGLSADRDGNVFRLDTNTIIHRSGH